MAGVTNTQTLTNKTLTSPVITGSAGAAPTTAGQIQYDSTANQLKYGNGTQSLTLGATDGWTDDTAHTPVYVSASTFKFVGVDLTAIYKKGTKFKWKEGSNQKYGVLAIDATFSTDTTVTLVVNTDYVLTNTTLSSNYYSYQLNPQGYPTYFNYTPTISPQTGTFTGATITSTVQFALFGAELHVRGTIGLTTLGSGSPTNDLQLTYPGNITPADVYGVGFGREISNTGIGLSVNEVSSKISMRLATNASIMTAGNSVVFGYTTRI